MKPLRLVLVMIEPPLPFGNAVARWYYVLLKGLAECGHRVTAFATCSQAEDVEKALALFPASAFDLRCYEHPQRGGLRLRGLRDRFVAMFVSPRPWPCESHAGRLGNRG